MTGLRRALVALGALAFALEVGALPLVLGSDHQSQRGLAAALILAAAWSFVGTGLYRERRRVERDLHDGAQQRLVALTMNLRLARDKLDSEPGTAAELLDEALTEVGAAIVELRELARGIHPAVLSDRGLDAALGGLAERSPVPVSILETPGERLPEAVELASYFVIAEALTNVARYAEADEATVRVARRDGLVEVEVRDDGVGGADPAAGSGLRGLADRVAALEGRFEVGGGAGEGTTVRASIPCA